MIVKVGVIAGAQLERRVSCAPRIGALFMPVRVAGCAGCRALHVVFYHVDERGHQQHRDQSDREASKQLQLHCPSPCGIAGYLKA
jgi:hypothetical protein